MRTERRPLVGAALLLLALFAAVSACDEGAAPSDTPTAAATAATPPAATPNATPQPGVDLSALLDTRADLPANDPIALAARYGETDGLAPGAKPFAGEPALGSTRPFFVVRISGASGPAPETATVTAQLIGKTEHAYFYADRALGVSESDIAPSAGVFESETWPVLTAAYGLPPAPGVDGDARIVVLLADLGGVGGYQSGDDLFVRAVRPLSNEAEMVYIDGSNPAGSASFDVVLAHELQHLIHEQNDADEEAWVNEGLSIAAEGLVRGGLSTIESFADRPGTQLNRWEFADNLPHYGAGGAFFRYLAARFSGGGGFDEFAGAEGDGPAGVDEFLRSSGSGLVFAEVFADWIAANVLNRTEGPYGNPRPVNAFIERGLAVNESAEAQANQFGTDYYELSGLGDGEYLIRFDGAPQVDVLPVDPDEGAFFWSNRGDGINTTLTREIDLPAGEPGSLLTLTFETWYDIERYYDRGYVSVSPDQGATWRALVSTSTITDDPVELAYGPGFEGLSGGSGEPRWVTEEVDLSEFRGQTIQVRFEYVTDGGTHGEGWAVRDNVQLDDGLQRETLRFVDWTSDGWVLIDRSLPQEFVVRVIGERNGTPVVLDVPLGAGAAGTLRFDATGLRDPVLAIAGASEGTNQRARYTVELSR